MYAIIFDINVYCIYSQDNNDNSTNNIYSDIRKFMQTNHFSWQQGGVYFSDESINSVDCVLTIQKLSKKYPWIRACAKDIKMLRIEESSDLLQVLN